MFYKDLRNSLNNLGMSIKEKKGIKSAMSYCGKMVGLFILANSWIYSGVMYALGTFIPPLTVDGDLLFKYAISFTGCGLGIFGVAEVSSTLCSMSADKKETQQPQG